MKLQDQSTRSTVTQFQAKELGTRLRLNTRLGKGLYTTHGKHEAEHEAKVCWHMRHNMRMSLRKAQEGEAKVRQGQKDPKDTPG